MTWYVLSIPHFYCKTKNTSEQKVTVVAHYCYSFFTLNCFYKSFGLVKTSSVLLMFYNYYILGPTVIQACFYVGSIMFLVTVCTVIYDIDIDLFSPLCLLYM